ncbi:hypothetical protein GCM10009802_13100 [Streptomyces synnematoformans]|uniref:Uncharacterized protein n=1 Tax=Streptomyces synnematoformans TaxID=415721 RepID=A0ABN2XM64_9ACTN
MQPPAAPTVIAAARQTYAGDRFMMRYPLLPPTPARGGLFSGSYGHPAARTGATPLQLGEKADVNGGNGVLRQIAGAWAQ